MEKNEKTVTLKKYIDYLWNHKQKNHDLDLIIDNICNPNNKPLIKYFAKKGWDS